MSVREGLPHPTTGEWITPEAAHELCAEIMKKFDSLPRHLRDFVNKHGYLTLEQARSAGLK